MRLATARKRLLPFAVAVVLLLLAVPVALAWPFGDVPAGHWAYNAIQRVAYLNITAGCGGGNYCPDDYVTRAQMAGFLNKLTTAWTDKNEPYIFSVDNKDDGSGNSGDGIIAQSYAGIGLKGISYGGVNASHGVYGRSNSTDSQIAGVYGVGWGNARGVRGESDAGGVMGLSNGAAAGVYGRNDSSGAGVYGYASGRGVHGFATAGNGVVGETNWLFGYGLYTEDAIYTGGGCVGCTSMLIAQNGGDAPLEPGDVVAVVGIAKGPSEVYARPVLLVRKADGQSSQGVVGVVERRYVSKPVEKEKETETAAPGEELTVIYRGIAQVKVDAASGDIQVGDLLVAASTSGRATKVAAMEGGAIPSGTIIGKALEPLGKDQKLIWVLVDLQ